MSSLGYAHRVRLAEPEIGGGEVLFGWKLDPPSDLYHRSEFRVSFPAQVDLARVPRALWWRLALLCLHTHWALLGPCRVELPIGLDPAELEFWGRMIDNVAHQIELFGGPRLGRRSVDLVLAGEPLPRERIPVDGCRAAISFSGGKDSIAVAALLAELTARPLLVTTTSPVPWARDHVGVARERTLAEITRRLPVDLVEVESDYRTAWDLDFTTRLGCRLGTHELSDVPFFQAVTIAVAAAAGIGRAVMASEADIQYNGAARGDVVLHQEFLSGAVHQASLDALLRDFGMRQGSVLYPLHMPQVQRLLLERYPDLVELQFSCWQATDGQRACSACGKCYLIALVTLAAGATPMQMGIDPAQVICETGYWRLDAPHRVGAPRLHETRSARQQIVRCLQSITTDALSRLLAADHPRRVEALAIHERMRADALAMTVPDEPGYIGGLLDFVHDDLRAPVQAIFDEHFEPAPEQEFAAMVDRARSVARELSEPLVGVRSAGRSARGAGQPLHLCLLCRDLGAAGGLARAMLDLAVALADRGHLVRVLTDVADPPKLEGVVVQRVGVPPVSWTSPPESALHNLMCAAACYREVRRVHEHGRPVDAVLAPLWRSEGAVCLLDDRFPTVISCMTSLQTLTEVDPDRYSPSPELELCLALERAVLQRAPYLHGLTASALAKTIDDYRLEPRLTAVVARGLRDRRTSPPRAGESGVLFVGRIEHRKGADVLLRAAALLLDQGVPTQVTLVGPEGDPALRAQSEALLSARPALRAAVRFTGSVTDAELDALYAGCQVVCVPSRYESHGIVLVEAMMFGKPIVTCATGGITEVVEHGREALLCPPDDPPALAASLRRLREDPELRAALGAAGRARYEQRYESHALAEQMQAFIEQLIEQRRSRTAAGDAVAERLSSLLADALATTPGQSETLAGELLDPGASAWISWAREHDPERLALAAHAARVQSKLDTIESSRSWRLTEPARALARRARTRIHRG